MIHVAENVYIDADQYCFIVKEKTVSQKGEEYFINETYHPTREQVVRKVGDMAFKSAVTREYNRCIALVDGMEAKFGELLKLQRETKA